MHVCLSNRLSCHSSAFGSAGPLELLKSLSTQPQIALMSPEERKILKTRLTSIAEEIHSTLAHTDPSADSITPDRAIGRLTRMEAIQAQQISEEGRRRLNSRLEMVERALEEIDEIHYGVCTRCGQAIPLGRLEIVPETRLCISCASPGH